MGQVSEALKRKLQLLGYKSLPSSYHMSQKGLFISENNPIILKGFSILLNSNEVEEYINHLAYRKKYPQNFIQILYVDIRSQQDNYCKLIVYLESMVLKLQEIFSINFNHTIKIIYHALKDFQLLFEKFGYFTIEASMIGVNHEGKIKCWASQKLSHSKPKSSYSYEKIKSGEAGMTEELKKIFQCITEKKTIPINFKFQSQTFEGLIVQLENKIGHSELNTKLQDGFKDNPETNIQVNQKKQASSLIQKSLSSTQIRFNYQMKPQNNSNFRFTYNNRAIDQSKSLQTTRKSIPKINFKYQQNTILKKQFNIQKSLENKKIDTNLIHQ